LSTTKRLIAAADQEPEAFHIPLPPSLDPWYRAPDGFNWWDYPPGTVLKIRRAPLLNYTVGNAMAAYQILYRSTDSQYNAAWDVTTLFIPWWQYRCSATTAHLCQFAVHYLFNVAHFLECHARVEPRRPRRSIFSPRCTTRMARPKGEKID
jgi:hypothetical protein